MRLGRILIIVSVFLIITLGIIYVATTYFGVGVLGGDAADLVEATPKRAVVVLTQPVATGEKVSFDMLRGIEIEDIEFNELMFIDKAQVVGLYARSDYDSGQVLSTTMMVSDPTQLLNDLHSGHASIIPPGMVAVQIPISRFSGMAYGLTQGDRVNVIATISFLDLDTQFQTQLPNYLAGVISPGQNVVMATSNSSLDGTSVNATFNTGDSQWDNLVAQSITGDRISIQGRAELDSLLNVPVYVVPSELDQRPRIISQTVLFNRAILHIGNFPLLDTQGFLIEEEDSEFSEPSIEGENAPPPEPEKQPDILTLIVTPQEAVSINFMLYSGIELTLALRSPNDLEISPTDAVDLQYMMDIYRIPLPEKSPYGLEPPMFELTQPPLLND